MSAKVTKTFATRMGKKGSARLNASFNKGAGKWFAKSNKGVSSTRVRVKQRTGAYKREVSKAKAELKKDYKNPNTAKTAKSKKARVDRNKSAIARFKAKFSKSKAKNKKEISKSSTELVKVEKQAKQLSRLNTQLKRLKMSGLSKANKKRLAVLLASIAASKKALAVLNVQSTLPVSKLGISNLLLQSKVTKAPVKPAEKKKKKTSRVPRIRVLRKPKSGAPPVKPPIRPLRKPGTPPGKPPRKIPLPKPTFRSKLPFGKRLAFDIVYREKGKVKRLNTKLPLNKALRRATNLIDNTLARSMELRIVGLTKQKDIRKKVKLNKFRTRRTNKVLRLVEKAKHAIDKRGEKKGLTVSKALKKGKKKKTVKKKKK